MVLKLPLISIHGFVASRPRKGSLSTKHLMHHSAGSVPSQIRYGRSFSSCTSFFSLNSSTGFICQRKGLQYFIRPTTHPSRRDGRFFLEARLKCDCISFSSRPSWKWKQRYVVFVSSPGNKSPIPRRFCMRLTSRG